MSEQNQTQNQEQNQDNVAEVEIDFIIDENAPQWAHMALEEYAKNILEIQTLKDDIRELQGDNRSLKSTLKKYIVEE